MAKFIEHRNTMMRAEPAWQLTQGAWLDNDATGYCEVIGGEGNRDQSIRTRLLTVRNRGRVHMKTSNFAIKRKLNEARDFSEATDVIVDLVWGEYVAILEDSASARRVFMTDPLYSVRLYYRIGPNGEIRLDTRADNLLDDKSIEWNLDYLIEFATTQFGQIGETPFSQIKVVPPGHALLIGIDGEHVVKRVWYPKPACDQNIHSACAGAISHVYSSISANYSNVCAAISGGVDSSSGAIFLRKALGPDVPLRAIHLFSTSSPEFNEYSMARQVADSIDAELICIDVDKCLPFSDVVAANPPSGLSQDMLFLSIDKAIAEAIGSSTVVLEGQGGDLLFNAVPDARAVLDALRNRGWAFALRTAEKLAMLHNESVPRVLMMAGKIAARERLFRRDSSASTEPMSRLLVPLHRNARGRRPRSKNANEPCRSHFSLQDLDCFTSVMTPVTDLFLTHRINPFLAQPIVEAAMNITSYESFDDRNDRIVLRRIAHEITSVDVLWRRTKGTFDVGFIKGIQSNHDALRELLCNGVLMQAGRIDERELRLAFKETDVGQGAAAISLALLGCAEIFCRSWQEFLSSRAAASF